MSAAVRSILRNMTGRDLQFEPLSQDCLKVLSTYAVREVAVRARQPDGAGWLDRVDEVPGVEPAALTMIHGFLIAQGMLKFEITGRSVGLQYQLSSFGRETLARESAGTAGRAESDSAEDCEGESPVSLRDAA